MNNFLTYFLHHDLTSGRTYFQSMVVSLLQCESVCVCVCVCGGGGGLQANIMIGDEH